MNKTSQRTKCHMGQSKRAGFRSVDLPRYGFSRLGITRPTSTETPPPRLRGRPTCPEPRMSRYPGVIDGSFSSLVQPPSRRSLHLVAGLGSKSGMHLCWLCRMPMLDQARRSSWWHAYLQQRYAIGVNETLRGQPLRKLPGLIVLSGLPRFMPRPVWLRHAEATYLPAMSRSCQVQCSIY